MRPYAYFSLELQRSPRKERTWQSNSEVRAAMTTPIYFRTVSWSFYKSILFALLHGRPFAHSPLSPLLKFMYNCHQRMLLSCMHLGGVHTLSFNSAHFPLNPIGIALHRAHGMWPLWHLEFVLRNMHKDRVSALLPFGPWGQTVLHYCCLTETEFQ